MFTLTQTSLLPGFTNAQLLDAITAQLVAVGGTLYDTYTNGRCVSMPINGTAKGTVYQAYVVSGSGIGNIGHSDTWNTGTHTGTSTASVNSFAFNVQEQVNLFGFNGPEGRFVILDNGGARCYFGYMRPATKHAGYDEATYRYAFLPSGGSLGSFVVCSGWTANYNMSSYINNVGANTQFDSGYRQILTGKMLYTSTSSIGVVGIFGDDVVELGATNLEFGKVEVDILTGNTYFVASISGVVAAYRFIRGT